MIMAPNPALVTVTPSIMRKYYTFPTVTPLSTIYTPPASCSTGTITLFGGYCNDYGCTRYSPQEITSNWDAVLNLVYWTTGSVQVGTSCVPPGTQWVDNFHFFPAKGCPQDYTTATQSTGYYDGNVYAVCCPS